MTPEEVEDAEEYIRKLVKQMAPDASGNTSTSPANSSAKSKQSIAASYQVPSVHRQAQISSVSTLRPL